MSWAENPPGIEHAGREHRFHLAMQRRQVLLGVATALHAARLQARAMRTVAQDEAYERDEMTTSQEVAADVAEALALLNAVDAATDPGRAP